MLHFKTIILIIWFLQNLIQFTLLIHLSIMNIEHLTQEHWTQRFEYEWYIILCGDTNLQIRLQPKVAPLTRMVMFSQLKLTRTLQRPSNLVSSNWQGCTNNLIYKCRDTMDLFQTQLHKYFNYQTIPQQTFMSLSNKPSQHELFIVDFCSFLNHIP